MVPELRPAAKSAGEQMQALQKVLPLEQFAANQPGGVAGLSPLQQFTIQSLLPGTLKAPFGVGSLLNLEPSVRNAVTGVQLAGLPSPVAQRSIRTLQPPEPVRIESGLTEIPQLQTTPSSAFLTFLALANQMASQAPTAASPAASPAATPSVFGNVSPPALAEAVAPLPPPPVPALPPPPPPPPQPPVSAVPTSVQSLDQMIRQRDLALQQARQGLFQGGGWQAPGWPKPVPIDHPYLQPSVKVMADAGFDRATTQLYFDQWNGEALEGQREQEMRQAGNYA